MKNLMLLVLMGGLFLTSCQKDDLSSASGLEGVMSTSSETEEICEFPSVFTSPALLCVKDKLAPAYGSGNYFDSYFDLEILNTDLAGRYAAWCIDQGATLAADACGDPEGSGFGADVYSTYDYGTALDGKVTSPANFFQVNYLLNQDLSEYPAGAIQAAIWQILGEGAPVFPGNLGDLTDVATLVALGQSAPAGYEPDPNKNENLYVVLVPANGDQSVIIPIDSECEEEEIGCETAFAKRDESESFCDEYDGKEERWGWNTALPTDGGPYTFDVWAGAGQCDTGKGTLVGTATLTFENGGISVVTDFGDNTINAQHYYAGQTPYPLDKRGNPTLAPGKYYVEDLSELDVAYVILHWEVCGEDE